MTLITAPLLCGERGSSKSSRDNSTAARTMEYTPHKSGSKRKLTMLDDSPGYPRPKRISPFLNTPKQRREEKRKVLRMSIQKLRQIDDPECLLHRSVLINNTMKRMQRELREEKPRSSHWWSHLELEDPVVVMDSISSKQDDYEIISNDHLMYNSHLFDNDPDVDKMTKEMTQELCKTVDGLDRDSTVTTHCLKMDNTTSTTDSDTPDREEPLNLSTTKRTDPEDSKDSSTSENSCDSDAKTAEEDSLSSSSSSTSSMDSESKCLCLSEAVCDCSDSVKDLDAKHTATSSVDVNTSTDNAMDISFNNNNNVVNNNSFFSTAPVLPLDFSASSPSTGSATNYSSSSSSTCYDSYSRLDYDLDCFPSYSDHERHMNDFDSVFNNLISVLTGS